MRILIAGCWRTGTTALYNITRLICEADGETYAQEDGRYDIETGKEAKHQIVKTHKFNPSWVEWASTLDEVLIQAPHRLQKFYKPRRLIFVTDREEAEILASMERFKKTGGTGNATNKENIIRGLKVEIIYLSP